MFHSLTWATKAFMKKETQKKIITFRCTVSSVSSSSNTWFFGSLVFSGVFPLSFSPRRNFGRSLEIRNDISHKAPRVASVVTPEVIQPDQNFTAVPEKTVPFPGLSMILKLTGMLLLDFLHRFYPNNFLLSHKKKSNATPATVILVNELLPMLVSAHRLMTG